jgi:serine/threonine-protein kinase
MLFEMAVGNLPIYPEPIHKLRHRKLTEPLGLFNKRPSEAHPRVDDRLEAIILRAMARDPEQRYPTCKAMADDLREYESRVRLQPSMDAGGA